jgi:hypothetical protein
MLAAPALLQPQTTIRPPAAPRNQSVSTAILLNHLFVVIDPETYRAIAKSEFVRTEFAAIEQRATERADQSYRGMYLYGANTYIEFFQSAEMAAQGYKLREVGIAFGVEEPGAIVDLETRMSSKLAAHKSTVTRKYSDDHLPWFYMLQAKDFPFRTWVMEYHPSFLAQWNPSTKQAANEGIARATVLDRYKSVIDDPPKDPSFRDITGITMAADKDLTAKLTQLYQLWGMRARTKAGVVSFEAGDLAIHLVPETPTTRGIQQIDFRLNRLVKDQEPQRFGEKSVLTFRGKFGTWTF